MESIGDDYMAYLGNSMFIAEELDRSIFFLIFSLFSVSVENVDLWNEGLEVF